MKIKLMFLSLILASTGVMAQTCLTPAQQKVVNRNYKNSLYTYSYVKVDCSSQQLKAACSDAMNVKMLNTMIRMNVWDQENALKTEILAQDLADLQKYYAKHYSKASCQKIKKDFFGAIADNGGWDY